MAIQCPSVQEGFGPLKHEPCSRAACTWWDGRCTAVDTVPRGRLRRRLACPMADRCRWAKESPRGVCPPMTHGELCEHQGGTFNTFDYEPA